MLLSASGIFSRGRWYHGCIRDSERTALLVQEGDSDSMLDKWNLSWSFSIVLFTLCVCVPGWYRTGCHQWLISLRRFHLQTTSQTLQGSALLHPPTGAIYRGSIARRWRIKPMNTQTGSLQHFCLCQTSFQTELGQALDLMTAPPGQIDLNRFTMDR